MGDNAGGAAESFEVTDLKQGVKNPNRVNVFVGGKFAFSLDLTQVVDYHLKIGLTLAPELFKELKKASEFGKLYQRALEWVIARPRSEREVRDYLQRKVRKSSSEALLRARRYGAQSLRSLPVGREDSSEDIAELADAVIERLSARGYLDDERFAEFWVENRFVKKGVSAKRLKMELVKKGVAKEVVEKVLQKSGRNDAEEIKKIIAKRRKKYTRVNEDGETEYDNEKLISYLCRQGFSYELAKDLVANFED